MSKENLLRFMLFANRDENVKSTYEAILRKYEENDLPEAEREKIMQEELIALAGKHGFDVSPENFGELPASFSALCRMA